MLKLLERHKVGVIISSRIRTGQVWPNRKGVPNKFMFVEFANSISVAKAMKLASSGKAISNGKKFNIFRAGSGTYIYVKSRKNKIRSMSETNIFDIGKVAKHER